MEPRTYLQKTDKKFKKAVRSLHRRGHSLDNKTIELADDSIVNLQEIAASLKKCGAVAKKALKGETVTVHMPSPGEKRRKNDLSSDSESEDDGLTKKT